MKTRRGLSKSKLIASLQCQRRLWLSAYRPEVATVDAGAERVFGIGHAIGALAHQIYGAGALIQAPDRDFGPALAETKERVKAGSFPLYEATFQHDGLLARVDVLRKGPRGLDVVEVKSSTSVKDPQVPDATIQAWVMSRAGYRPKRVSLALVDTTFEYPGGGDYRGLLREENVTREVRPLMRKVGGWVEDARATLAGEEPKRDIGPHCSTPYPCEFIEHCRGPQTKYPVTILPRGGKKMWALHADGFRDLREVPEGRLTGDTHLRVWRATRSGEAEVSDQLRKDLRKLGYPRYYVDFETLWLPIPHWAGTRPYEQVPFQWSCHREDRDGNLAHAEFLADGRDLPAAAFIDALLKAVGTNGPIITYGDFEKKVLNAVANRFKHLKPYIHAAIERIVDLLPLMRAHYYHPAMMGSWSLKEVLPTVCPELSYERLGEVRDGGGATEAFAETLKPECPDERRAQLRKDLLEYCKLDTLAMVRMVAVLDGRRG
jgi:hypothetical protein